MNVIIDGVRYVPATEATPTARLIATELIAQFMGDGEFDGEDFDQLSKELTVEVNIATGFPSVADVVGNIMQRVNDERTS